MILLIDKLVSKLKFVGESMYVILLLCTYAIYQ